MSNVAAGIYKKRRFCSFGAQFAPPIAFEIHRWHLRLRLGITTGLASPKARFLTCAGGSSMSNVARKFSHTGPSQGALPLARKVQTVHLQNKSRCAMSPKAAKPPFFLGSGRDVWQWRSLQRRSKNGRGFATMLFCPSASDNPFTLGARFPFWCAVFALHSSAGLHSSKTSFFYRFWTRRLTLKITPTQVEKRCLLFPCSGGSLFGKAFGSEVVVLPVVIPKRNRRCKRCISKPNRGANWAPKLENLLFLKILDATFDIEDHSNAGRKTVSLSSPGHAVSLFRRQPFWEGFWVRSRGFAGRDTQTQPKVPTVYFEGNWRCKLRPKAAKPPFFIDSGRDVWHWRSLQRRSKNGVLELARPCCFPVPEAAFLGRLLGQKSWFCPSWRPNATEGANGVFRRQLEVQIAPHSCKNLLFF